MVTISTGMPEPVELQEKFSRRMAIAAMSNFRSLPEAVLELVDNAVDKFDGRYGGNHLTVSIEITRDRIVVENVGGRGMGSQELGEWLEWGESDTTDGIGFYGQGGKAAMGYLGNAWTVKCKHYDSDVIWEVRDDNWRDTSVDRKNLQAVPVAKDRKHSRVGYCRIEIRDLVKRRQNIVKLKAKLSDVYRVPLGRGRLTLHVKGEEIEPAPLPIYEGFPTEDFRTRTGLGWPVAGWIGRLKRDARSKGPVAIHGGMRLTRRGRLICDGEYFGHPDFRYKASLNTLIGEVELSKVPVLPNKTDFDRDSEDWEAAQGVMHALLRPHIEALLKQPDEAKVTKEEKQRVQDVRQLMIRALDWLSRHGEANLLTALGSGRKAPRPSEHRPQEPVAPRGPLEKPREPRSSPPPDAVGRLKRLGMMPQWQPRVLGASIRSDWEETGSNGKVLLINTKFPLWEQRKGDNVYIAETAALELAKPDEGEQASVSDYLEEVNRIMVAFCIVYADE